MNNDTLLRFHVAVMTALSRRLDGRDERGDVPGWVMITVMSATIVAALTLIAGPELSSMLRAALNKVR